jgi:transcriptional regulator with XRE-family HTH domain
MISSQTTTEQPQRVNKRSTTGSDAFVGKQIKIARLEIGVSQTELGEAIGVTFQQIQKYEKGQNRVSVARLMMIARALCKPMEYFYEDYRREAEAALTSSQAFLADPFARDIIDAWVKLPAHKRLAFRDLIVGIAELVEPGQATE